MFSKGFKSFQNSSKSLQKVVQMVLQRFYHSFLKFSKVFKRFLKGFKSFQNSSKSLQKVVQMVLQRIYRTWSPLTSKTVLTSMAKLSDWLLRCHVTCWKFSVDTGSHFVFSLNRWVLFPCYSLSLLIFSVCYYFFWIQLPK